MSACVTKYHQFQFPMKRTLLSTVSKGIRDFRTCARGDRLLSSQHAAAASLRLRCLAVSSTKPAIKLHRHGLEQIGFMGGPCVRGHCFKRSFSVNHLGDRRPAEDWLPSSEVCRDPRLRHFPLVSGPGCSSGTVKAWP